MRQLPISTIAAAGGLLAALGGTSPAWAVAKTVYTSGVTAPGGLLWLNDQTAAGGHLWISDHLNGFCRLDPVGTGATATINTGSCLVFGATTQAAYDPAGKWVYVADISAKALGVRKVAFNPATGLLNKLKQSSLAAPTDAGGRGLRLTAAAVDSKGNLYVGNKRTGDIYVYPAGATATAGATGTPRLVGTTEDGGGVLSFAFGKTVVPADPTTIPPTPGFTTDDLYVAGVNSVLLMPDTNGVDPGGNASVNGAGACSTANPCTAVNIGFGVFTPQSVAWDGTYAYAGDVTTLHRINPADGSVVDYATGFSNLSAIAVSDKTATVARKVFGADDPSAGAAVLQGHVYRMNRQP